MKDMVYCAIEDDGYGGMTPIGGLINRSRSNCVFVPVRCMQFLAVITDKEIIFVISQADACKQNEGGRLIMLSWIFPNTAARESLNEPVDCELLYYHEDSSAIQLRPMGDFR
ncbi:MAG: hypothetical protein WBN57_04230 [Gammaproteobacteria bacterium]